jgi:hypothetical protein
LAESSKHIALVQAIVHWIETQTNFSQEMAILVASPSSSTDQLPPIISGRIPDVFAQNGSLGRMVIGEAKTASDIETYRSRKQFEDYLQLLGLQTHSLLIVSVPWHCVNQARSLLRSIQKKTNTHHVEIIVLEKLSG